MAGVFGKMLNNLRDEKFVQEAVNTINTKPVYSQTFETQYASYQEQSAERFKKKINTPIGCN